jgi:TonB family protein
VRLSICVALVLSVGAQPHPPLKQSFGRRVTPRSALPIRQGPVVFVDPRSPCPRHTGPPFVLGAIVDPPLLEYTAPRKVTTPGGAPVGGRVLVEAQIDGDGTVETVKVLRGPVKLRESALEAVNRWKFARACLNGRPVPLIKVVMVDFPPTHP